MTDISWFLTLLKQLELTKTKKDLHNGNRKLALSPALPLFTKDLLHEELTKEGLNTDKVVVYNAVTTDVLILIKDKILIFLFAMA